MVLQSTARIVWIAVALILAVTTEPVAWLAEQSPKAGKPQLVLRVSPAFGFPPLRAVFTAELIGGANDYEQYYCGKVEWDWADDTTSSASYDCEPYEAGKSEIRRRFTVDHTFREPGRFEVTFRLKQGSKVVAAARTIVQVRDGVPQ